MTKTRKGSIATNHAAIEAVEAVAVSRGQTLGPVLAGSYLAGFPSHVTLDGVNIRVVASSPRTHADGRRDHAFRIRPFRDIAWQALVCMPLRPTDDPIIFMLPQAMCAAPSRIVIDPQAPGAFEPYRWSPETRQERRRRAYLDAHVWDYC